MSAFREENLADGVRLILGDCREILPTLSKVDAVVTDPPYGIGFKYLGYNDTRENLSSLIDAAIKPAIALFPRVIITPGQTQVWMYPPADWISSVNWDTTATFGHCGYSQWMPVLIYGKDVPGFGRNAGGILKSDVIRFSGGAGIGFQRTKAEKEHTCAKPLNVMRAIVARFTEQGNYILDPFMGSGTTGCAVVKLGRKFIGIEITEGYFDLACRRINEALKQPDLFIERPNAAMQESML
jgi:DNA modification methylase